jgi:OOP family OmpA-OmpF porin
MRRTALIVGCTTALPPEKVEAIGPPFNDEIKRGYLQLASTDSRFHDKARRAMLGADVWPDKVGDSDVPADMRPEALVLRERLVDALEGNARLNAPVDAAAAQTNFDCWLEESADRAGSAQAAACKEAFLVALAGAEAAVVMVELPDAFRVFFGTGRSDLDTTALRTIDDAARGALAARAEDVEVIGFTDRSGDPAANEQLALRRSEAVAAALSQAGVPRERIIVNSGGEAGTLDDRESRRVDIVIDR